MLSNTFSTIVSNATAEIQYRHAVQTLEGVKGDAIFAYQPPFNILAMFILVPLRWVVSPRWFHKIHVFFVRLLNLPLLLIIAAAERRVLWPVTFPASPSTLSTGGREQGRPAQQWFWEKWRITTHGDIHAVFYMPPPEEISDAISVDDDLTHNMIQRHFQRNSTADSTTLEAVIRRRKLKRQQSQGEEDHRDGCTTPSHDPAKTGGRTLSRRDSMAPFPGLRQELQSILTDSEEMSTITSRLDALEESNARIEAMLAQLLDDVDDSQSANVENGATRTGTLQDLDHAAGDQ